MLTVEDRLDLLAMPGRYGNAVDDRDWDALRTIFTDDAVFEVVSTGLKMETLDGIVSFMDRTDAHPLGHLMMNIDVQGYGDMANVRFRSIFPVANNSGEAMPCSIRFGFYYDVVVRTPLGWRVRNRVVTRWPRDMKPTEADLMSSRSLAQLVVSSSR